MRPLGASQRGFLEAAAEQGPWRPWPHGRWTWGSPSGSQRIADSLVKRGLLVALGTDTTSYYITAAGRAALARLTLTEKKDDMDHDDYRPDDPEEALALALASAYPSASSADARRVLASLRRLGHDVVADGSGS